MLFFLFFYVFFSFFSFFFRIFCALAAIVSAAAVCDSVLCCDYYYSVGCRESSALHQESLKSPNGLPHSELLNNKLSIKNSTLKHKLIVK